MAKISKQEVLNTPINYLYIFINESFITLVGKYINSKAASTIRQKALNQRKVLANVYGSTKEFIESGYTEISEAIEEQYNMTPQTILKKLLHGETVAGKNWKKGIYGIGSTPRSSYALSPDITVDGVTGQIMIKGSSDEETIKATSEAQKYATPIYKNVNGNTILDGYAYQINGYSFTTKLGEDGKYYAGTIGDANGMYAADGAEINASNFENVWACIETCVPLIEKFIAWLASLFNITTISRENTYPAQSEFMVKEQSGGLSTASIGIIGTLLIGGTLMFGTKKTKRKK